MRTLLLVGLLTVGLLLAAAPAAARPPPPQCVHGGIEVDLILATVRTTCGEGIIIDLNRDPALPPP